MSNTIEHPNTKKQIIEVPENDAYNRLLVIKQMTDEGVANKDIAATLDISAGLVSRCRPVLKHPDLIDAVRNGASMNSAVQTAFERGEGKLSESIVVRTKGKHRSPTRGELPTITVNVPGKGKVVVVVTEVLGCINFEWNGTRFQIKASTEETEA